MVRLQSLSSDFSCPILSYTYLNRFFIRTVSGKQSYVKLGKMFFFSSNILKYLDIYRLNGNDSNICVCVPAANVVLLAFPFDVSSMGGHLKLKDLSEPFKRPILSVQSMNRTCVMCSQTYTLSKQGGPYLV